VLVAADAVLSWVPADALESVGIERYDQRSFRRADGTVVKRWVGAASIYVDGKGTSDDIVFGEAGEVVLLGWRTLEGLNLRVDPVTKQLVDAGPAPAAVV
jgi:predicted aspartyl protease